MSTGKVKLRRADPGDADAIRALTRKVYAKWFPVGPVALVEMIPMADHLLIENISVREDWQGQGLATASLTHAEDVARERGLPEIRLYTNAAFTANLAFYRRRGFGESGRETLSDGGMLVHFSKAVS
jgi:GNAT superfamily N-acetyltransferase